MSGAEPEGRDEMQLLAGEYVLCVLDGSEMRAVDRQASADPVLAQAIAEWERRLAPMLSAVPDVAAPDSLWARIAQSAALAPDQSQTAAPAARPAAAPWHLAPQPAEAVWPRPVPAARVWPWKAATGASLALAASLAGLVLLPTLAPPPPREPTAGGRDVAMVAVLTPPETPVETRPGSAPQMANATDTARLVEPPSDDSDTARTGGRVAGFLIAGWPDGTVVLTAFAPVPLPPGKTLELWMQSPDGTARRALGLFSPTGRQATLATLPPPATVLSLSVEPAGGSPTGAPTGPIAFTGTVRRIQP
jgi:anti-sigma-K factor RskA